MARERAYKNAGVDIDAQARFIKMLKERVEQAWPDSAEAIGSFAGGGQIPEQAKMYKGAADGTGTKIMLAAMLERFAGIGKDAVAMSAGDAYVSGAKPAAIYDILDVAHLQPDIHIRIIDSIIGACQLASCRLLGGETAELPGLFRYRWGVNLNTFVIAFDAHRAETEPINPGQCVYGWRSDGPASNGFSLIRKVFDLNGRPSRARTLLARYWPRLGETLADSLLRPTPIWIPQIEIQRTSRAVVFCGHAHITGGGMIENIPRILPTNCKVVIDRGNWRRPPIFSLIQQRGNIPPEEMDRVFNQGIMIVSIVSDDGLQPDTPNAVLLGQVEARQADEPQVRLIGQHCDE
jgi:phosphoribosylformylglycinamidine cyclo-ligase